MQFSILQNSFIWEAWFSTFSNGFEPFSGFNLSKWSFLQWFLVLLHSFFVFSSLKLLSRSSFVCFVFELWSFHNSLFLIASKCLNFLWCVFMKCIYKFLLEIWVILTVACWKNFPCTLCTWKVKVIHDFLKYLQY